MIKKEMVDNMMIVNGCVFFTGKSKKFDRDLYRAVELLEKENLTVVERIELLHIYQASYHESGKIERVTSYDSSATNCKFCKAMRKKAEKCAAHICNLCYDHAAEQYKINSLNRHSLNMLIMQTVAFTVDELRTVPAGMINRIDSAGDMPNSTYAENMVKIAIANSNVRFAFWTKNTLALIAATDKLGKPGNAVYIQSSEIIGRPAAKAKYFDYVFTVYPDKESVKAAIENGAAECNGKKCLECGFKCYNGTHKAENIAELLRGVSAAKRDEIKAWLANN